MMRNLLACAFAVMTLSACASGPIEPHRANSTPGNTTSEGPAAWVAAAIAGDGPGRHAPSASPTPVTVKNLPKSRRGNPSEYTVGGVRYAVMDSAAGFIEQGHASWYGRKFHGRETSSGEVYDMYELTAAHKHLPLPTFVRVTRVDTGDSIVVKVNDRGPFVPGRIIDLSYQAAASLGVVKDGTAPVIVEALSTHLPTGTTVTAATNAQPAPSTVAAQPVKEPMVIVEASAQAAPSPRVSDSAPGNYLQLGAFSEARNAQNLRGELSSSVPIPIVIDHDKVQSLFRVWVGPLQTMAEHDKAVAALQAHGVTNFTMVTLVQ